MWLVNYPVCIIKGHDLSELTSAGKDYTYCHRCGRIRGEKQPEPVPARVERYAEAPRPTRIAMPIDKIFR